MGNTSIHHGKHRLKRGKKPWEKPWGNHFSNFSSENHPSSTDEPTKIPVIQPGVWWKILSKTQWSFSLLGKT
jgi:hypothetical protein